MFDLRKLKYFLKSVSNIHIQGAQPNIFLFATPRGGSTWLMEVVASQPGMKYYDEPFNIRRDNVKTVSAFSDWSDLMPDTSDTGKIFAHLHNLQENRIRYMNPPPFRKNHRFVTSRVVFKIHELEHMINDVRDEFKGYILFLVRHPIANTISRHVFPRLEYFINSDYYRERYLDEQQLAEIRLLINHGSELQKGIVSWCYENIIPLNETDRDNWVFVSYEEMLLNPEKMCKMMADQLKLPDLNKMLTSVGQPAMNIKMSNRDTLDIINNDDAMDKNIRLVTKWKARVSEEEERQAFEILDLFKLDIYKANRFVATDPYLNFADTIERL